MGTFQMAFNRTIRMSQLYDLRAVADLLWPVKFFRPALDTEVMLLALKPN